MAGHTLVYIISQFVLGLLFVSLSMWFVFGSLLLAVLLLEIGVAFLQAYVFTVLTCIYLSDTLNLPSH